MAENNKDEVDIEGFPWLDDEEWSKAIGQLRLQISGLLSVFDCYGMGIYIAPVSEQILDSAIDFSMRVRGADHPIGGKHKPMPRPTE